MDTPFKHELKTGSRCNKVASRESYVRDCLGMWFLASSEHQSAETTSKAIDNFLHKSKKMIVAMPERDFNALKKAM